MFKKNSFKLIMTAFVISVVISSTVSAQSMKMSLINKLHEEQAKTSSEWTLMLYCGGDEDPPIIGSQKLIDLFKGVSYVSNENLNVIVLVDYGEAFLGVLKPNEKTGLYDFVVIENYDEKNMGDYASLRDFIKYCKTNYPADRYFLQIVGHAFAFYDACPDFETGFTILSM